MTIKKGEETTTKAKEQLYQGYEHKGITAKFP